AATGFWASPFVFTLLTTIVIAGFAQGFGYAMQGAAILTIALSVAHISRASEPREAFSLSATWTALFFLIAVVAGVGRKMSGQADRERDLALDRLGRLADANALLYSLHKVAQTLPSSLDMDDVVISTVSRLRELLDFDAIAILLFDETTGDWDILRQEGCRLPARMTDAELPAALRRAATSPGVVRCDHLGDVDGDGLSERSGSALYSALTTRGTTTGLIAVERRGSQAFDHRAANLLAGFVPPLAMALDNARWFSRLRTVGANEERNRIARDLHDRIGQSLAYLAFELDRLINHSRQNEPIDEALEQLREDLRGVVREVRDTLYDLRTDVSERNTLDETLTEFVQRVQDRSGITITVDAVASERLPLLQEREMWRIAQEALTNVERHSRATAARVSWRYDGKRAAIRVIDDGIGFQIGQSGRLDSYGMLGMRERASSIGATLEVHSTPGEGTSVTCVLDPSDHPSRSADRSLPGART
ncbi:MAG: sensor histidine kinase, partial [Actinobacteria bacterium]|nr:sensor histidine kinase [Actinomycetota bacterium]